MAITIAQSNYGKSHVRLLKIARQPDRHDLKELTVGIEFEGNFDSCYQFGDNTRILPTDTLKNTIYAFAKLYAIEQIEEFARLLAEHFLTDHDQITKARVEIVEDLWTRIPHGGKLHGTAFFGGAREQRTAAVTMSRQGMTTEAGIANLLVLRTSGAGFENYLHDPFTTLPEMSDRVLQTVVNATWTYTDDDIPYGPYWHGVRESLVETFVEHESKSLPHTLYAMAEAALERYQEISEVAITMPNKQCAPVDLSPFGLENDNEVFAPVDEPFGLIEARVKRES